MFERYATSAPLKQRRPSHRRGITLIELVVVLGMVTILGGLAISMLRTTSGRRTIQVAARQVIAQINKVRMAGLSGRLGLGFVAPVGPPPAPGPLNASLTNATANFQHVGVRIESATALHFFGDTDRREDNGFSRVLAIVDLAQEYPEANLSVTAPLVGSEIRFERNATRSTSSADTIQLSNSDTGQTTDIVIDIAGLPRIR